MIDSAITPDPTVATVRFESGDMRASIGVVRNRRALVSREIPPLERVGSVWYPAVPRAVAAPRNAPDRREPVAREVSDRLLFLVSPMGGRGGRGGRCELRRILAQAAEAVLKDDGFAGRLIRRASCPSATSRTKDEEPAGRFHASLDEARPRQGGQQLVRLVVDLADSEARSIGEAANLHVGLGRAVVRGARFGVLT